MKDIYIFRDGEVIPAKIERLFKTHGPYTLEGKRLDLLSKVQVVVDSSSSSTSELGTSTSNAKTGNMLGRAIVGGVLTGGVGAVIGGLSGARESIINSVTSESINTQLTTELIFEDRSTLYLLINNLESFHWLLGFSNQEAWSEEKLSIEKNKALNAKFELQLNDAHEEAIEKVGYPRHSNKEVIKKAEIDILNTTFEILKNTPDIEKKLDYIEFLNTYRNIYPEKIIESNNNSVDYSDKYKFSTIFFLAISVLLVLILIFSISSFFISDDGQGDIALEKETIEYFNQNSSQIIHQVKEHLDSGRLKEAEALSSKYLIAKNQELINLNIKINYKISAAQKNNSVESAEVNTKLTNKENIINVIPTKTDLKERITKEELDVRNDIIYLPNEDKPFTGVYETYYPNGNKKGASHIKDGKFNGLMTLWDENGLHKSEKYIKDGLEAPVNKVQPQEEIITKQGGFGLFNTEAEMVKNRLSCPNSVDSDITPALDADTGALYGCIQGKMETVKWFINEVPNSNHISNVKFLWNDWYKDMGYGLHSDKQEAKTALKLLIQLYAPEKEKELNKIFFGNKSITINSSKFIIKYTYSHGPAIDERMIIVTENEAIQNISSPVTEIKSLSEPIKNITGLQWQYTQAEDKMSGGTTYHAAVLSTNTVNFDFPYSGSQNATLRLRSDPKSGKNLMFSIESGQILCTAYDGCSVLVRFDNEKPTNYSATAAADNSTETIFIDNYNKFVEKMLKAQRVRLSINIYQQGAPVFEFDVSYFDKNQYKPKK